ncbi:TetR/AcrR family transcriptional regulator [Thalassomonas actiniarum]|uniref:TetR/AcrR family transcriptional regulator n=1 Tax=Thalassomonas actiniarum TaxID=485447 RepID=A0AAE9YRP6_9GAMM|nr:TetR/AcrR family transcriptional regulator [Thalassomonas actiniarum]WDD99044.1 TetR/AcrR family transcriptional regulator [Thalassomonas actiniarum]
MAPAPKFSMQEQEKRILDAAEKSIENSSLLDFTMSAIAKGAGLSMGSIYKHVQSKEDVLVALAANMYANEAAMYHTVLTLPLTIPEKIIATNLIDRSKVQTYSFEGQLDNLVSSAALLKRGSPMWLDRMRNNSKKIEQEFDLLFSNAAQSGEFISGMEAVEEIGLLLWSLTAGYFQLVRQHQSLLQGDNAAAGGAIVAIAPDAPHIRGLKRILNAYEWQQPLTQQGIEKACRLLEDIRFR